MANNSKIFVFVAIAILLGGCAGVGGILLPWRGSATVEGRPAPSPVTRGEPEMKELQTTSAPAQSATDTPEMEKRIAGRQCRPFLSLGCGNVLPLRGREAETLQGGQSPRPKGTMYPWYAKKGNMTTDEFLSALEGGSALRVSAEEYARQIGTILPVSPGVSGLIDFLEDPDVEEVPCTPDLLAQVNMGRTDKKGKTFDFTTTRERCYRDEKILVHCTDIVEEVSPPPPPKPAKVECSIGWGFTLYAWDTDTLRSDIKDDVRRLSGEQQCSAEAKHEFSPAEKWGGILVESGISRSARPVEVEIYNVDFDYKGVRPKGDTLYRGPLEGGAKAFPFRRDQVGEWVGAVVSSSEADVLFPTAWTAGDGKRWLVFKTSQCGMNSHIFLVPKGQGIDRCR